MNTEPLCCRRDLAAEEVLVALINTAVRWRRGSSHEAKRIDEPRACRVQDQHEDLPSRLVLLRNLILGDTSHPSAPRCGSGHCPAHCPAHLHPMGSPIQPG